MDNAFRKLDVDQYSEDRVLPTDLYTPDPRSASQVLSATQSKLTAVRSFLQRGEMAEALGEVLKAPPFGEGVDDSKVIALGAVVSVLNSTKSTEIPALLAGLSTIDQITLMKYLYKAMENLGESNGNVILGWHEKLVETAGTGCIVRVMTDHRRV